MRGRDAAPKCEAFREARRDRVLAAAAKSKLQDAILIWKWNKYFHESHVHAFSAGTCQTTGDSDNVKRVVCTALFCLVLVVPVAHGIESSSDWQVRIDREIGKMRKEAARLHEEGDRLWNRDTGRGRADANSAAEDDKQMQTRDRQKKEYDEQAQTSDRQKKEDESDSYNSHHESSGRPGASQKDAKGDAEIVLRLTSAAEQGDARAQCALGTMYAYGRGVPKDEVKAAQLYEAAAGQKNADAQCALGTMYAYGRGVPKDDAKAVQLYEAAAGQKNADAQYALGWMYAHGRGVPRDEAKAVQWCLKAAEQGVVTHASCQNLRRTAK